MIFSEKQRLIRKSVQEFAEKEVAPLAAGIDETGEFPEELYQKMIANNYMGITLPKEYGSADAGYVTMAIVMEEIARKCASTSLHITAANSLLGLPIANYGTEQQKEEYLRPFLRGKRKGTFALTEPGAGSDAAAQKTTARRDGDDFVLNGRKTFITDAPDSDFAIVFAVTDKAKGPKGITAFFVERDMPGYSIGKLEDKMGMRGSHTSDIMLNNVRVHKSKILGREGEGFKMAMRTLDSGRIIVSAQGLGIAQSAMDEAVKYVKEREQFGKKLAMQQGVQFLLADMETKVNVARAMVYDVASKKDLGLDISKEASIAKYFSTETAVEVAGKALQLHGGYGYMRDYPIERIYRNARVTTIYEGTSQIQQIVIAKHLLKTK